MKLPRERTAYSAIVDRAPLKLPGKARLVVWPIVNLEVWEITRPMPRQVLPAPSGVGVVPDFPNWAWHEYGMRVGFWRLKAALYCHGITPTLSINAAVTLEYPRVAEAAKEAGWEFMGHSFVQMPIHQLDDQKAVIAKSLDTLEAFVGRLAVRPALAPRPHRDLRDARSPRRGRGGVYRRLGLRRSAREARDRARPAVALPYTVEQNDIPMMIVQHHRADELYSRNARRLRSALRGG